jgi:hypothetical protein
MIYSCDTDLLSDTSTSEQQATKMLMPFNSTTNHLFVSCRTFSSGHLHDTYWETVLSRKEIRVWDSSCGRASFIHVVSWRRKKGITTPFQLSFPAAKSRSTGAVIQQRKGLSPRDFETTNSTTKDSRQLHHLLWRNLNGLSNCWVSLDVQTKNVTSLFDNSFMQKRGRCETTIWHGKYNLNVFKAFLCWK